ncbi:MAG: proline racemase family protein [Rhodobacteraceae bacterium]|nr:proline racemase family protein [Paracoccaceae bacterium]
MRVIDSHTEGEPTRVIVSGGPDLGSGAVALRAECLARDHAPFCASVVREPRGSAALVAALLVAPSQPDCAAGVIYFNTVGNLGMCGHASIGTAITLAHMGRIGVGMHKLETPVGVVSIELHSDHEASITNVESYRLHKDVRLDVPGLGQVTGDIAWGGNWFFITRDLPWALHPENIRPLTDATLLIRQALQDQGWSGANGAWIDHVIALAPCKGADARNFVLCPSGSYDRSPCGTGTSALLACLAADGQLDAGATWVQQSVIGSTYRLTYVAGANGGIIPTIRGRAWITAKADLHFAPSDPYAAGIPVA